MGIPVSACTLDGVSFDRYGLVVEAGGETLAGTASVKQGLTRQFAGSDGRWYDTGQVVFGSKEATFKCCLVAVTLNWSFDRPVESQSLDGEPLAADVRTATFGPIRDDRVYTLTATAGNQTVSRTAEVCFRLKKYYGVSPSATLTDLQIRELASAWAAPQQAETRFDCTGGKYPYYILPASMAGGVRFWVGGLQNTDWQEERREVANASGYAETYVIFRLNRIQTGVLNL